MKIDTFLSPAELPVLARRDLRGTACVVFDILRATSSFVTALHHGANTIIPVSEIAEAIARRRQQPDILLAGERDGMRIRAAQSGGVDFDFGNSPREFTAEKVRGKTIVATTTNGTRALRACAGAKLILAASFLNLSATAKFLTRLQPEEVLLVCAGTGEGVALEDVLAAGALIELLAGESPLTPPRGEGEKHSETSEDSSRIARQSFLRSKPDLAAAIGSSQNGRRLLAIPELRGDVAFCAQRDVFKRAVRMDEAGLLRAI